MRFVGLLPAHAAIGLLLLGLGLISLLGRKSRAAWHTRAGSAYFWVLTVTVFSGLLAGALRQIREHSGISPFEVVSLPTWCFALAGYLLARRRPKGWLRWHISAQASSFIGVVTAGCFLARGRLLPDTLLVTAVIWALPQLIGATLIIRTTLKWVGPPRWLRMPRTG